MWARRCAGEREGGRGLEGQTSLRGQRSGLVDGRALVGVGSQAALVARGLVPHSSVRERPALPDGAMPPEAGPAS